MEFDYSSLFTVFTIMFVLILIFNIWYFRRLLKIQQENKKEIDQLHLNNIEKWKEYAMTCNKFKNGECDLSIPCDICKHYTGDKK